jgi:hypothetical protein
MKKLFTILLLGTSCLTAFSQEKGDFEFGLHAGLNLATVTSGAKTNTDYRVGLDAGVFGDYFFSSSWSIKAKLVYDQKGWNNGYISIEDGPDFATNYRYDYLTVPVMANWHFGNKRNWYINGGPYAGFLISAKETAFDIDLKEISNTFDAGLAIGIGVKIPLANKIKLLFEADGQSGFVDVLKNNQGSRLLNSRSSINAGLVFAL